MRRPLVIAYVSGHGFGHFVRTETVLEPLAREHEIHVCTNGRALEVARQARWPASVREVDVGPGAVQHGPLATDVAATRAALARHLDAWPRLVDEEAAFLRESGAGLVFADVPPIALAAAARAGVPSLAFTNFTWSWIYDGFAGEDPWFAGAAARLREAESRASLLLALEGGGGLDAFSRATRIPPVVRPLSRPPAETRAQLPFADDGRPIVLLSLGGFGRDLALTPAPSERHRLLVVGARVPPRPDVRAIAPGPALPHPDLVAAVDCVIGKPGYGTVAECLARPTPFCWLDRAGFREHDALAALVDRWLPSARLTLDALASGRWAEAVDRALAARPLERPPLDGAAHAADAVRALLRQGA